ncbi:MAG: hypothetical protein A3G93_01185 [Nitrospinae bacterium RIFCSPLOWO2_12_FULL_45_22]|nr:MAG: hypothetical protein A3G93_01185 [Nitrospinae bacterium RIFCSPLOWO2_12_FULL_45_22]
MIEKLDKKDEIFDTIYHSVNDVRTKLDDVVQLITSKQAELDGEAGQNMLAIQNLTAKIKELEIILEEKKEKLERLLEAQERYQHLMEKLSALEEYRNGITGIVNILVPDKKEKAHLNQQMEMPKEKDLATNKKAASIEANSQQKKPEDADGILNFRKRLFKGSP